MERLKVLVKLSLNPLFPLSNLIRIEKISDQLTEMHKLIEAKKEEWSEKCAIYNEAQDDEDEDGEMNHRDENSEEDNENKGFGEEDGREGEIN